MNIVNLAKHHSAKIKRIVVASLFSIVAIQSSHASQNDNQVPIPQVPHINAEAYVLIDYNSGKILAEMNGDVRRNPASLTKMMTSYVIGQAVKAGKIKPSDVVTVGKDAWATGNPIFKGSSLMFLKPGDKVTVNQLSQGIIVQSGNDACVAMADYLAGSQDAFVNLMNDYVQKLGLENTHFETVHGLDAPGQYSSAHDMVLIARALIHDVPQEYTFYKEKEFTYDNIRQYNRNGLLWDNTLNVDGLKTGHTATAGYNLVASATEGNMRLISAVLGGKSFIGREQESKKLLTWGFRFFQTVHPLQANKEFITLPVWFGNKDQVQLGVDSDVYLTIPRGRMKDLKASYVLNNNELRAPLSQDQQVGMIDFMLDGKVIGQRPLVVLEPIEKGSLFSRLSDYIKLKFHHWFK